MSPHESDWFSIIGPKCTNVFAHNVALWTLLFSFGLWLGILPSLYLLSGFYFYFFGSIVWVFSKGAGDGEVPMGFVCLFVFFFIFIFSNKFQQYYWY